MQEWYAVWLKSRGALYCASLGGRRVSIGVAVQMKRAGYVAGYPDMCIEEPRGPWHGMRVELKVGQVPSPAQRVWQQELMKRNIYAIIVPHNLDYHEACNWLQTKTEEYLRGEVPKWHSK